MRGRKRCCWAALPNVMITGPTIRSPKGNNRGAPQAAHSSSKMNSRTGSHPVPPCSSGTCSASSPSSPSLAQTSRLNPSFDARIALRRSTAYSLATKRWMVSLSCSCSLVRLKSIYRRSHCEMMFFWISFVPP